MLVTTNQRCWSDLGWGGSDTYVCIDASGRSGGILLAWKTSLFDREEIWRGRHIVAARLTYRADGRNLVVASAYGPSNVSNRGELWEDLTHICETFPNTALLIGGDFNVTLNAEDRPNDLGGNDPGSARFRETLAHLSLGEMGPANQRFTWHGPTSQSRIDRFLYSPELCDIYALAEVTSLPRPVSDHTPLVWASQMGAVRPTYFKLDRSWFRQDGFKENIEVWWRSINVPGSTSTRIANKLLKLRHHIFETRRQIRLDSTRRRDEALRRIESLDILEGFRPLEPEELMELRSHRDVVAEFDLQQEMDWRQRSRQLWLAAGDANTRFFHQVASGRRRQNFIRRLRIGDQVIEDQVLVGQVLSDHYREFYRRGLPNRWKWTPTTATTVTSSQKSQLSRPFSIDEVKADVWGLNSEGAPGPDGIPIFFYKNCWDTIAPELMHLMEDVYTGQCQMERLNKVYIVLLPKIPRAESIGDFRPIALSNSIYLIIAKVLANRLREVLDSLICPLQSAFIPGRQMIDSIVMAEEIVAAWRRSGTSGFLWKVDFAKAYDSIDWRYLWNVLRRRGFPEIWVRWMKLCVSTSSCSVLVNGRPQGGWFQPQRGIRQGCPLAPLLFILAVDTLAFCMTRLCSRGHLLGFQTTSISGGIPLLQFADDTTFFIQGSEIAARTLSLMMEVFTDISGLQLNRAKSTIIGFGLDAEELSRCAEILATPIGTLPIRYLGLPLTNRRLRTQDWQPVMAKVESRLSGWRGRLLSRGGRLILVKSVLSALPTFFMSVFQMPAGVRRRLESIMRQFFWHGTNAVRGGALVAWDAVCRPLSDGGLGIRHLHHNNSALMCKWIARVMKPEDDMLSHLLHEMYGSTLDWNMWATPQRGDSPFMAGLRGTFPLVQQFFRPQLGNGAIFRFWTDNWSDLGRQDDGFPRLYALAPDPIATVQSAWTGAWSPALPMALSDQRVDDLLCLQARLANLRPSGEENDAWIWRGAVFSTKAAYKSLRGLSALEDALTRRRCRWIWKRRLPLKIRLFAWLLLRRHLMTWVFRQHMYPDSPLSCPLCNQGAEDCDHLFFQCSLAQESWHSFDVARLNTTSAEAFWSSVTVGFFRREADWRCIFAVLWAIWTHRNEVIFRGASPSGDAIIYAARGLIHSWHRDGVGLSTAVP